MSWKDKVRKVDPYVPGEQPKMTNMIKLNTNENPYPPSPLVEDQLRIMDAGQMRLYPDAEATELNAAIAAVCQVDIDQVFSGVGSDDVIDQIFLTFFTGGGKLYFPDITYSFYRVWAQLYRIDYEEIPLAEDWHIRSEDYIKGDSAQKAGIIFANPNAPTGLYENLSEVESIIAGNPDCVVVVDEAYIDYGGESAVSLINKYDNLIVVRTFSKSRAMAGMRIGFAMGNRELIKCLKDVKYSINSYTMNTTAIKLGVASRRDDEYFRKMTDRVIKTRERSKQQLTELGFEFPDSCANFIFAKHKKVAGKELFEYLRSQNIFVRRFEGDRIKDHLRITIGTDEQMDKVFDALRVYLW